eukprot:g38830.t1
MNVVNQEQKQKLLEKLSRFGSICEEKSKLMFQLSFAKASYTLFKFSLNFGKSEQIFRSVGYKILGFKNVIRNVPHSTYPKKRNNRLNWWIYKGNWGTELGREGRVRELMRLETVVS